MLIALWSAKGGSGTTVVATALATVLARSAPDMATKPLLVALQDRHFVVRESAVDALADLGLVDALPAIRPLLHDPHPHVRQAAQTAVEHLG